MDISTPTPPTGIHNTPAPPSPPPLDEAVSNDPLDALLKQIIGGWFILTDGQGAVSKWAEPAEILFGREAPDALGHSFFESRFSKNECPSASGASRPNRISAGSAHFETAPWPSVRMNQPPMICLSSASSGSFETASSSAGGAGGGVALGGVGVEIPMPERGKKGTVLP